jgi:predicted metal-binding protein
MDRESADVASSDSRAEPLQPNLAAYLPNVPVIVSVCTTCKTADGGTVVGPDMFAAVRAAFAEDDPHVVVRPVQCLSVCKRPATVAVTSPDGYTFLFGDLQTESGTAALASFVSPINIPITAWYRGASALKYCARACWPGCLRCAGRRTTGVRRND